MNRILLIAGTCLLGLTAATDILVHGRRIATLSLIADNLTDAIYVDRNPGRNFTVKLEMPLF